ncbi:C40 family peptidase [Paraburkholderia caribensis]|uniref:C40 family peptidase n=1 Tax=Paraburkholderia caribensis TaxID=75105 RepID=A0A9Q6RXV9_9BURK|nr:C40 family peptidase [Paraburkholderia caribensis]MCO4880273.1 C40 family peptidase [Paraburkholderia caribensis]PTB24373.1 hydrolase Nlp/P60 [Paraburkholderia caribensis]QLB61011.1 hydrolase Nlp/P60 [Paraburkholderia caribensis]
MLRLALSLLLVALLAACSGAPQKTVRSSGGPYASSGGAYRTAPPGFPRFVDHSIGREEISIQAMSLVGVPYRWGGNTPDSGFDCSGLVHYVVQRAASVNLPRTTADMSSRGDSIEPDEIAPGDLIFFNTTGRPHSHVGIYVGKLRFVNAPSTGGTVRLDYLTNPYWAKRFDGIRRVAPALNKPTTTPFDAPSYEAAAPVSPTPAVAAAEAAPKPAAPDIAGDAYGSSRGASGAYAAQTRAQPAPVASQGIVAPAATAAASVDQFEPPPPGMSAAQLQARAAGAMSPTPVASPVATAADATSSRVYGGAARPASAPDAIDAAADAYEPPPPAAVAARQARQAQVSGDSRELGGVQIMRASTASRPVPAPTQTNDDPIAGFANY